MGKLNAASVVAGALGADAPPRGQAEDDFIRWLSEQEPKPPTIVGEALPPGVPTMASRYGVFGAKSLITGVPGDENKMPVPCPDAEAQPAAPCTATGECPELLALARRYTEATAHARRLTIAAEDALEVAQVLMRRVQKAAVNLNRMPQLSHFSAGEPNGPGGLPWSLPDMLALTIRGPILHNMPVETEIDMETLPRMMEKWDYEHRVVEYLQRAEDSGPVEYMPNIGRMPIYEPMPKPTPVVDRMPTPNPLFQPPTTLPPSVMQMSLALPSLLLQFLPKGAADEMLDRVGKRRQYMDFLC
eukprot:gb/GFBE01076122.1/.p1 GENE.gb/GFBE01076122.1/~~gb/GFBE01076122.1/.p1  ORF type:complete len:301 (+),score=53.93 gb/GFBE01076122.1/:1-903(+)